MKAIVIIYVLILYLEISHTENHNIASLNSLYSNEEAGPVVLFVNKYVLAYLKRFLHSKYPL